MTLYYPPAALRLVPLTGSDPRIRPVGVILHVAATEAWSLFGWFNGPSGGIESHLYLRYDGTWEQYRDLEHEADANYKGNSWVRGAHRNGFISVETQGLGPGEWTPEQIAAIKEFLGWASKEFGFPLRKVTAAQPASPATGGVGYHTQFASWSNVAGKTCPGPQRIKQFHDILVPWMEGNEVTDAEKKEIAKEVVSLLLGDRSAGLRNQIRLALDEELGDESGAGSFSDRVAEKVAAKVTVPVAVPDPATLAASLADNLAARLRS